MYKCIYCDISPSLNKTVVCLLKLTNEMFPLTCCLFQ